MSYHLTHYFLIVIVTYLLISILISFITVNKHSENSLDNKTIYLSSNGVHLSVIIPKGNVKPEVLNGLQFNNNNNLPLSRNKKKLLIEALEEIQ